jgi:hypothetical protein
MASVSGGEVLSSDKMERGYIKTGDGDEGAEEDRGQRLGVARQFEGNPCTAPVQRGNGQPDVLSVGLFDEERGREASVRMKGVWSRVISGGVRCLQPWR